MNSKTLSVGLVAVALAIVGNTPTQAQGGKRSQDCQGIPCGHLPPPGLCRAWFPGVPPGQQPPPTDCRTLERTAPPQARIIYGSRR